MKILITGAFGNIGSHCVVELLKRQHTIRCLDVPQAKNSILTLYQKQLDILRGDIRNEHTVAQAVEGQDLIIHLAAILPPYSDKNPALAEEVNVEGTRILLQAAQQQPTPPKLLFSSSFDLFGPTQDKQPLRTLNDPVVATDPYTHHKIMGEEMVKASTLSWTIYRFVNVPLMMRREIDPIMYRIPLNQRMEFLHPEDAALAIANGVEGEQVWNATWLIGGGEQCQRRYGDYIKAALDALGLRMPPKDAFGTQMYCTDWVDSTASQQLLRYQRHTFEEILQDVAAATAPKHLERLVFPLIRPLIEKKMRSLSPYYTGK